MELANLEGGRDDRCGEIAGCEGVRPDFVGGAIVSPSLADRSSTSVASLPESSAEPHAGQQRLASEISLEQKTQRIKLRRLYQTAAEAH